MKEWQKQIFGVVVVDSLFESNQILSLVDSSKIDFACYPNLFKMFYANLNREFIKEEMMRFGVISKALNRFN